MERFGNITETWLGRFLRGILKLALATFIVGIIQALNFNMELTIDQNTYDLTVILNVIQVLVPAILVLSALRDMGVEI